VNQREINDAGALASNALPKDGSENMEGDINMNNHKIINLGTPITKDNAVSKEYVDTSLFNKADKNDMLLLDGSNKVVADFDMNNQKITKLSTNAADVLSATNVMYVNQAKADLTASLTASFNKKISESHIRSTTSKKDVFRYLMDEVNKSTGESNIIVDGIKDFPASPHDVNKKAYSFRMGKGSNNEYSSRLSFNMYLLPWGEYTLVIEFFPPTMDQVTVSVVSTSLNISQQSTKLFPQYSRSIVH